MELSCKDTFIVIILGFLILEQNSPQKGFGTLQGSILGPALTSFYLFKSIAL